MFQIEYKKILKIVLKTFFLIFRTLIRQNVSLPAILSKMKNLLILKVGIMFFLSKVENSVFAVGCSYANANAWMQIRFGSFHVIAVQFFTRIKASSLIVSRKVIIKPKKIGWGFVAVFRTYPKLIGLVVFFAWEANYRFVLQVIFILQEKHSNCIVQNRFYGDLFRTSSKLFRLQIMCFKNIPIIWNDDYDFFVCISSAVSFISSTTVHVQVWIRQNSVVAV